MAEPTQYTLSLKEVGEIILRENKITTGKWAVGFNMFMNVGNFQDNPGQPIRPGAMIQIASLAISKVDDPLPAGQVPDFIIDASKLK